MINPLKIDAVLHVAEDHRLILALQDGDEGALKELIHKFTSPLLKIAESILHDEDVAKDIVQDIFCWIWENRKRMSIPGSLIGYLGRATSNRAISELRSETLEQP